MKHPLIKILIAILLGVFVLMFASVIQMIISNETIITENFPPLKKTAIHLGMLISSILIILILTKGKLNEYGFNWNFNFPFMKIVFISLAFGFLSSVIGNLFINSTSKTATMDFTLIEQILYIWLFASISEEVFTRGLIQGFLSSLKHIGFKFLNYYLSLPVIIGAIFFGAMHLALLSLGVNILNVITIVVLSIVLGLIAGYQKEKTNSLVPAIIVHMCFNIGGAFL